MSDSRPFIPAFDLAFGFHYLSFDGKVSIGKIQKKTKLDSSDIEIWGLRMKKPEPSHLYQITEDVLLCSCSPTLSPEDFYSFSSTVFIKTIHLFHETFSISNFN